jgi:hypothetical protein
VDAYLEGRSQLAFGADFGQRNKRYDKDNNMVAYRACVQMDDMELFMSLQCCSDPGFKQPSACGPDDHLVVQTHMVYY